MRICDWSSDVCSSDLEGARAATLQPKFERVAVGTVELLREIKEGAVQQRAVVVGELYEPGLGDQPAELEQMFGARAPCHDPLPIVVPRPFPLHPVAPLRNRTSVLQGNGVSV